MDLSRAVIKNSYTSSLETESRCVVARGWVEEGRNWLMITQRGLQRTERKDQGVNKARCRAIRSGGNWGELKRPGW